MDPGRTQANINPNGNQNHQVKFGSAWQVELQVAWTQSEPNPFIDQVENVNSNPQLPRHGWVRWIG